LEVKEVRRLAQEKTKRAFEIVAGLMENAEKDAVRLAAALAVLRLAGVRMDGEVTVNVTPGSPANPYTSRPTSELLSHASTSSTLPQ
jgi:hypothetical protein